MKDKKNDFFIKGAHLIKDKKQFNKKAFRATWDGTIKIL